MNKLQLTKRLMLLLSVGLSLPVNAQTRPLQHALIGDSAYVVTDPRAVPIPPGQVRSMTWSPSGNQVLFHQIDRPSEAADILAVLAGKEVRNPESLYLWNRTTNVVQLVERVQPQQGRFERYEFLPDERFVIVGTSQNTFPGQVQRARLFGGGGRNEVITAPPPSGQIGWAGDSQTGRLLMFISDGTIAQGKVTTQFRLFDPTRGTWSVLNFGLQGNQMVNFAVYSERAKSFYISTYGFGGSAGEYLRLDPATGRSEVVTKEDIVAAMKQDGAANEQRQPPAPFILEELPITTPAGVRVRALSLGPPKTDRTSPARPTGESNATSTVLAIGIRNFQPSPRHDGVLALVDGVPLIYDILKLPKSVVEQFKSNQDRSEAIIQAKQVGLSIIMYSADNDDVFPTPGSMPAAILPYLKDAALANALVYTYSGPFPIAQINDPAQTELGYIPGPGGRAIIYADSSVRWKPDP